MKRLAMAGVLMMAGALALPTNAQAGVHVTGGVVIKVDERGYGDARGGNAAFRYGYDRGWRDGSSEGYRDGRSSRRPRYLREGEFRNADRGYKGWMGARWEYTRGFREGFESGYRRAFASARPSWNERNRDRWGHDGRYYPNDERDHDRR
jgi:hypothetical protein